MERNRSASLLNSRKEPMLIRARRGRTAPLAAGRSQPRIIPRKHIRGQVLIPWAAHRARYSYRCTRRSHRRTRRCAGSANTRQVGRELSDCTVLVWAHHRQCMRNLSRTNQRFFRCLSKEAVELLSGVLENKARPKGEAYRRALVCASFFIPHLTRRPI
jgi:hypothetical protein